MGLQLRVEKLDRNPTAAGCKMSEHFDNERFANDISCKAFHDRVGQNVLARKLGLSPSTLFRIVSQRKDPSVDSLAALLNWLGRKFEDYVL